MPKKNAAAEVAEQAVAANPHLPRIVRSFAPEETPVKDLSGTYRVIHGALHIAVPREARLLPDGTENPHAPKTVLAKVHAIRSPSGQVTGYKGDEVYLPHADAKRCLEANVVEELDAKPSRCGKVFTPAKEVKNYYANAQG